MKYADAALRIAVDRARAPQGAAWAAEPDAIQVLCDLFRRLPRRVVAEDAADDLSLLWNDLALPRRDDAILERANDAIAEADATAGLAELDAPAKSTARLVGQFLEEQRVHRPLEADVEVRDVALGEHHDVHAGERQALEQAGGVFLVTAEAVQCFGQDDVDLAAQGVGHHRLEARPQERGSGDRVVRVFALDVPALALRELPADAELVGDRRVSLVLRGVAGVDGNLHSRPSSVEPSGSSTVTMRANISRAACRASSRANARSDAST